MYYTDYLCGLCSQYLILSYNLFKKQETAKIIFQSK